MKKDPLQLTVREKQYFDLLNEDDRIVDRSYFIQLHEDYPNSNVVDVHVRNLRKKLEGKYVIDAHRGEGYSMHKV